MIRIMGWMAACLRATFPHSAQSLRILRIEVDLASPWKRGNANIVLAPSVRFSWFPVFVSNTDEVDEPSDRGHPAFAGCIPQASLGESRTQGGVGSGRQKLAGK